MKRLNNKGFAISTMLYGILTMVVLILTLLLTIMQSSYNKENAAVENITYYLNKCMAKQVAVEDCFRTYNDNPSNPVSCYDEYEAYTSCLGSDSTIISANNTERLSQLLFMNALGKGEFVEDENIPNRYIYVGSNPTNYLKFGNKLARIISIEPDGKIKAMFVDKYSNLQFDNNADIEASNGKNAWGNSALIAALKNKTAGISYSDLFVSGKFYTGTITENSTPKDAIDTILGEAYENENYKVGVISLYDYVKASKSASCDLKSTSGTIYDMLLPCRSENWLLTENNGCSWSTTGITSSGKIDKYFTMDSTNTNKYSKKDPNEKCEAALVFYLASNTIVDKSGLGTNTKPYIIVF